MVDIKKKKVANISIDGIAKIRIQGLEGWSDIQNVKPDIKRNEEEGGVNLIIFDADTDHNEGGFDKRTQEIQDKIYPDDLKGEFTLHGNCIVWTYDLDNDSEEIDSDE